MRNCVKRGSALLIVLSILVCIFPVYSFADGETEAFVPKNVKLLFLENAKTGICDYEIEILEGVPKKENRSFMLPAKYLFEKLGYEVSQTDTEFGAVNGEKSFKNDENITNTNGVWYAKAEICTQLGYEYEISDGFCAVLTSNNKNNSYAAAKDLFGIYVSPNSDKASGGNPEEPIAVKALSSKLSSNLRKFGDLFPVYVFMHGGEYRLDDTIDLSGDDITSLNHKPVYIEAYGDGKPILSGAKKLNIEELAPVTEAEILARVPKNARKNIASMDLSKYNIDMSPQNKSYPYVYIDDREQILSRWPNFDFAKVKSVPTSTSFCYSETEPSKWTKASEAKIYGFFAADYFFGVSNIASINTTNQEITTSGPHFGTKRAGARWYAVNLLEEIDLPGEWFVDREKKILYFYPPYAIKDSTMEMTALHDKPMINLGDAQNLSINGISFTKGGKEAVAARTASDITIKNCDISFMQGDYAIHFNKKSGTFIKNITIDSNECYGCAGGFVFVTAGNPNTLENGNTYITNNHVACCGSYPAYINGVVNGGENSSARYGSMGTVVRNNVFQDNRTVYAISLPGNDVEVDHNEIINQGYQIDDGGAIYFGKSHSFYGVNVHHNYIHDLNTAHSYCGLYNDDGYSGATWEYNVVRNAFAITINGLGMDETFNYNLGINCNSGLRVGSRMTWNADTFGDNGSLHNELQKVVEGDHGEEFLKKYTTLAGAVDRTPYSAPWNTVFYGNAGINTGGKTTSVMNEITQYGAKKLNVDGKEVDITNLNCTPEGNPHFDYSDDYFADPENQDYTLKPDSEPAKAQPMLLNINMREIGIKENEERLLKTPENGFRLRTPMNGNGSVSTKETVFSWDTVENATNYRVMIATDKDMQNIIYDNIVHEYGNNNAVVVDSLNLDTVYYWKVQAIGISRQNSFTVDSNGPFCFKTVKKNEINKENLKLAIESADSFYKQMTTLTEYSYDESFINEFKTLTDKANDVYKNAASQEELDSMEEEIYCMVNKSPYFMKVHYENLDIFDKNKEWTYTKEGKMVYNDDGSVSFTGGANDARAYIDNRNSVVCFKIKLDVNVDSEYQGVYFKYDETGNGYLVVFKDSIIEFQGVNKTLFALPNIGVKTGEWYDIQAGGINTPNGVLQFLKIDGHLVFAKLDQTPGQARNEGRIGIHHRSDGDMHFKKCDTLPEDGTIYDDILKDFNDPINENHLASLLIGANDAIETNSVFFMASDKSEIAKLLYPDVKNKSVQITDGDVSGYKQAVLEKTVLAGYNTSMEDYLFQNKIKMLYTDIIEPEKIDENGANLYQFYCNNVKDMDRIEINKLSMGHDCRSFEELRRIIAENIFAVSINACGRSFANDTKYFADLFTKANAEYLGINIDNYLALNDEEKTFVNSYIASNASMERTMKEIIEQMQTAIGQVK